MLFLLSGTQLYQGFSRVLDVSSFSELLFPASGLPKTALTSTDWWANDYRYPEKGAYAWINANYEVVHVNLTKEYVVFRPLLKSTWVFEK